MSVIRSNKKDIVSYTNLLAAKLNRLSDLVNDLPGKKAEILAIIVYAVAHFAMAIFHEPWYDEAVAWQISRCASIHDILFVIPHYEGHPPLWHLILLPFAKLNAPYEMSLSLVSFFFAGAAVYMILFKSPFPRIIRLLLPFTYFFFYQYGVISRPYCVMMLAFMLLAMNYHSRNDKPGHYTLCLVLLCLTSAYGIVIAGGLAIAWVWEICKTQNINSLVNGIFKDKRLWWLISLLLFALLLIAEIFPQRDTFATNLLDTNSGSNRDFLNFIYMFFCSVPDSCFTTLYRTYGLLQFTDFNIYSLLTVSFVGFLFWIFVFYYGRRKGTTLLLVIPYLLYSIFAALVYISPHHIGIGLLLIVFWLWVSLTSVDSNLKLVTSNSDLHLIRSAIVVLSAFAIGISFFWNSYSCLKDVFVVYAAGREEAKFIKAHGLDRYRIMVGWDYRYDAEKNEFLMNINNCRGADNVAPYFEHNIFFNFNNGSDRHNYSTHITPSDEFTKEMINEWSKTPPDVLFMGPKLSAVYGKSLSLDEYTLVYAQKTDKIWKTISSPGYTSIHVRNDLLEVLGLNEYILPTS